eukprot:562513-Amphidinium_carterae.1
MRTDEQIRPLRETHVTCAITTSAHAPANMIEGSARAQSAATTIQVEPANPHPIELTRQDANIYLWVGAS